ncbi:MAG TPA: ORF6N domain-containing protein [Pyrinomonadaceae bacterium]|nr:ORF6N domain-containing protein [Pyrinomonadaceae bacterium]
MSSQPHETLALQKIAPLIYEIRSERVILDSDLAAIYGVPVKALNQAVKRNSDRFPKDFAFRLTRSEFISLRSQVANSASTTLNRSQIVTGSQKHRNPRYPPYAFSEHGAIMAANVLNSKQAVQMSVFVVRAFVKLREMLATHKELANKLNELERKIGKHDNTIASIVVAIRQLAEPTKRESRAIGFRATRERDHKTETKQIALRLARDK